MRAVGAVWLAWWILCCGAGLGGYGGGGVAVAQQAVFRAFQTPDNEVALTFDDGPHAVLTPRLLDSLQTLKKSNNIAAHVTFFVMGVKVAMHPQILKRAVEEGHEIANHVWNHPVMTQIPWEDMKSQLYHTSEAIYNATGKFPTVMRPPYGKTTNPINGRILKEIHLPVILWSLDTLDWQRPSVDQIVSKAVQKSKPGTIILCHDIHPNTVEAIPILVKQLADQGYSFLTVTEMIQKYSPKSLGGNAAPPSGFKLKEK